MSCLKTVICFSPVYAEKKVFLLLNAMQNLGIRLAVYKKDLWPPSKTFPTLIRKKHHDITRLLIEVIC